jgi:hypothetical protein
MTGTRHEKETKSEERVGESEWVWMGGWFVTVQSVRAERV